MLCCIFRHNKNPYHSSHDSSAHTFSLHIRDKLCMLLLHIKKEHDAHKTHRLYLWHNTRINVTLQKNLVRQFLLLFYSIISLAAITVSSCEFYHHLLDLMRN